jgi:transcriptional regulator with XRE-family HTH domain
MTAEEFAKAIGAAIAAARVTAGLPTQQDLASLIGAHTSAVSRYETGRSRPPDDVLIRIEEALGLRRGQILVEAGLVDPAARSARRLSAAKATDGLKPEQVAILEQLADQLRKANQ